MIRYKALLTDLGFYVLRKLSDERDSCVTFRVYKKSGNEVVKMPSNGEFWYNGLSQVDRENEALKRARGAARVPEVYDFIEVTSGRARILALHKEYVPGNPLEPDARISDSHSAALLEDTVRELHSRGIAVNDLCKSRNIIMTPKGIPFIVDFGNSVFSDEGDKKFQRARQDDNLALNLLFQET